MASLHNLQAELTDATVDAVMLAHEHVKGTLFTSPTPVNACLEGAGKLLNEVVFNRGDATVMDFDRKAMRVDLANNLMDLLHKSIEDPTYTEMDRRVRYAKTVMGCISRYFELLDFGLTAAEQTGVSESLDTWQHLRASVSEVSACQDDGGLAHPAFDVSFCPDQTVFHGAFKAIIDKAFLAVGAYAESSWDSSRQSFCAALLELEKLAGGLFSGESWKAAIPAEQIQDEAVCFEIGTSTLLKQKGLLNRMTEKKKALLDEMKALVSTGEMLGYGDACKNECDRMVEVIQRCNITRIEGAFLQILRDKNAAAEAQLVKIQAEIDFMSDHKISNTMICPGIWTAINKKANSS